MSLETDQLNQPTDGDDTGGRHRFSFLHADTGVNEDGVNGDVDDEDAADDDLDTDDLDTDDAVDTGTVYDSTGDPDVVDADAPQPTFTPTSGAPDDTPVAAEDGQLVQGEVVTDDVTTTDGDYEPSTLGDISTVPADEVAVVSDAVPASVATAPPVAAFDGNAPLLGDSVTLKASWQQAAAEFVDDPRAAVAEAADLLEHTAQTLVGALDQRQRQLRGQWENGTTDQSGHTVDTEELRHLMQNYRALFNQLCAL